MLPAGLALIDRQGIILRCNPTLPQILGLTAQQLLQRPLRELIASAYRSPAEAGFDALRRGEVERMEMTLDFQTADQDSLALQATAWLSDPTATESAELVLHLTPSSLSASELKRLQESDVRLNAIHEAESLLIWMVDAKQCFSFLNRGWQEFSGLRIENFLGQHWSQGIHPDDLPRCKDTLERSCTMHQPYTLEYRRQRFDGEYRWLRETAIPNFNADGNFSGLVGTSINIEQIKHSEAQLQLSEQRYRAVIENSSDGFLFFNPSSGRISEVNDALCKMTGYRKHQFFGMQISELFTDDGQSIVRDLGSSADSAPHQVLELCLLTSSKEQRFCSFNYTHLLNAEGDVTGAFVFITDTHAKMLAQLELQRAATVFDICNEGIIITDSHNRIISANPAFSEITGYSHQEVLGRDPAFLNSGRQDQAFYQNMWQQLHENGLWRGELWNRRKSGKVFAEWLSLSLIRDKDGQPVQYLAIFSDITQRKILEERLRHEAEFDELTELLNRRGFVHNVEQVLLQDCNENQSALMFIDLDRFKWVNDTHGHALGDKLLIGVAGRLKRSLRGSDLVGRLGGDEFVILIPALSNQEQVKMIAQKLLDTLAEPFHFDSVELTVSASIGIALYPEHATEATKLMARADDAMYEAKQAGKGRYRIFSANISPPDSDLPIQEP